MKNKIDSHLLKSVNILNFNEKKECIIYVQNFISAKKYMDKNFKNEYESFPFINAFGISLNCANIFKIAKLNVVKFVSSNTKVYSLLNVSRKVMNVENVENKSADFSIVVIDTGIYPHLDFLMPNNKIIYFKDFINEKSRIYDDNGHGTFVAGILCNNSIVSDRKYVGVDNKSKIIILKALDKNGETSANIILKAMQWVYDNKKKYNIKIVNMSFGSLPINKNDPLMLGAEVLWDSGITVVCAAGNSGPENQTIKSPGYSSKIITVGGLNDNRDSFGNYKREDFEIASFSSRGPAGYFFKPDVIAPAVNITGASNKKDSFYTVMSGTSVATPMIAGVCCLILSKYPQLSPDQLKIRLLRNCKQITNNKNFEGFGLPSFEKFFIY